MDSWLQVLGGLAGVAAVAIAASWFAAGGSNALAGLVAGWREPEWPRGVQEDDDLHWAWRRAEPEEERHPVPEAERLDSRVEWRGR